MVDAFVRLVCPECDKEWQDNPADLQALRRTSAVPTVTRPAGWRSSCGPNATSRQSSSSS